MKSASKDLTANYIINFSPTDQQIIEIEKWLIDEYRKIGEGFYCNWEIIKSSYERKQLVTISQRNKTIGFAIFNQLYDKTLRIQIAEVKPSYRNKGIGKKLTAALLTHFKNKGVVVAYLQCSPSTS